MKESLLLKEVLLAASHKGARLFRNNSGMARRDDGRYIRYGVAPGGSDLIGWKTFTIQKEDVGRSVAVFVAIELKSDTGRATPAQEHFVSEVKRAGGMATIARTVWEAMGVLIR